MKTTKSRSCSMVVTFMSILLVIVLLATGCAQKVVKVEGPQINMMLETNFTSSEYDASSLLLWNIGQNTLQSSDTSVVHVSDFNNGGILCWQPGSPVRVVQQWSYLSKKPLLTTTSKDVDLLVPPAGMQYLVRKDGGIRRWYASDENAFVSVPAQPGLLNETPGTKTITITEQGVASGSKAQILTVPLPSGLTQMVVEYGSGSIEKGFVLFDATEPNATLPRFILLLRLNSGKATWLWCDDAFGGIITSDQGSSFARVGSLLYFTHTDMKIGCIDTSATSLSVTLPETINTLLAKLHREQPTDAPYNVQAQLASDNGTLIIEYPDANWNGLYYAVDASGTVLGSLRSDKTSITSFDAKGKQGSSINTPGSISSPSIGLFQ
ncbi:hypothetical protein [Candidatus Cryosericum terrychapinii]|jgi:hypothetical protein|uniref:Uncharacterized protein n=1 Tax=Candidatus Cryosericum terrychapinii TaxID=2290919 RepID=A0A398D0Z5_9BACT|nr:hypothetical protein [Candidatus Cryosericum terrychapinii]RIE05807.1 hypothetical protein SMC7_05250 [Candidatus Cryosericum terrychapinii]